MESSGFPAAPLRRKILSLALQNPRGTCELSLTPSFRFSFHFQRFTQAPPLQEHLCHPLPPLGITYSPCAVASLPQELGQGGLVEGEPPERADGEVVGDPIAHPKAPREQRGAGRRARGGSRVEIHEPAKGKDPSAHKSVLSHCPVPPCSPAHSPLCSGDEDGEWEVMVPAGMDGPAPRGIRLPMHSNSHQRNPFTCQSHRAEFPCAAGQRDQVRAGRGDRHYLVPSAAS